MKTSKNSIDSVWISPQFVKWNLIINSWSRGDEALLNRPYRMLEHAHELLGNKNGEFSRADAIITMKRALDVRLKSISQAQNLTLLFQQKKIHLIQALEICCILRPLMLRQLLDIRNMVEHEDKKPPNMQRCSEFEDYVWYFLKSTDKLVLCLFTDFEFNDPNSAHFEYDVQFRKKDDWALQLTGWFRRSHISLQEREGWLCCKTIEASTFAEFIKKNPEWKFEGDFKHPPADVFLRALVSINMQSEIHRKFVRKLFNEL